MAVLLSAFMYAQKTEKTIESKYCRNTIMPSDFLFLLLAGTYLVCRLLIIQLGIIQGPAK